jgi:hypothetical protein
MQNVFVIILLKSKDIKYGFIINLNNSILYFIDKCN